MHSNLCPSKNVHDCWNYSSSRLQKWSLLIVLIFFHHFIVGGLMWISLSPFFYDYSHSSLPISQVYGLTHIGSRDFLCTLSCANTSFATNQATRASTSHRFWLMDSHEVSFLLHYAPCVLSSSVGIAIPFSDCDRGCISASLEWLCIRRLQRRCIYTLERRWKHILPAYVYFGGC